MKLPRPWNSGAPPGKLALTWMVGKSASGSGALRTVVDRSEELAAADEIALSEMQPGEDAVDLRTDHLLLERFDCADRFDHMRHVTLGGGDGANWHRRLRRGLLLGLPGGRLKDWRRAAPATTDAQPLPFRLRTRRDRHLPAMINES